MAQKNAKELVKEALQPNEAICWEGSAEPFKMVESDTRKSLLLKWAGGLLGIAAVIGIYFLGGQNGKIVFVAIISALLLAMMITPFIERSKVQKYRYFLTNRRAIAVSGNGAIHSMELKYVDGTHVLKGHTAGDCLVLGNAMMRDLHKQLRWLTCHPRTSTIELENGMGMGMVFYSIKNADEAKACLEQLGM